MTKSRKTIRPKSSRTLPFIMLLLFGSAGIRVGLGVDTAFAVDASEAMDMDHVMTNVTEAPPAALVAALQAREDRLDMREEQFEARMQALRVAEAEINEKLTALAEAEASLSALLALADDAAENDLARLTEVYASMKPEDAAALFEQMEPGFAAGFMGRMQPAAAALIMTDLQPETAHLISVLLASRNATAPTE